jgi:hypothetical protein
MVWDIHVKRADRHDDHVIHLKARWTALGSIDDVSLDCGQGVHQVNGEPSVRRVMNAFSKPIHGDFRWGGETEQPEIALTWTDNGELCQQRILLTSHAEHHVLPAGLRNLLNSKPRVGA